MIISRDPTNDEFQSVGNRFGETFFSNRTLDCGFEPATKAECKNGGWRTFGTFKNQGDCVSFVRHQARQECIFIRARHGAAAFRAWFGIGVAKLHPMRSCVRQRSGD